MLTESGTQLLPVKGIEPQGEQCGPGAPSLASEPCPVVHVAGRRLQTTVVFNTYWRFAAARHELYEARVCGAPGPWTLDPILGGHRFTNCFRAADRVSQFLIRHVAYSGPQGAEDLVFRILLFKLFNKVTTWDLLERNLGPLTWSGFDVEAYDRILSPAFRDGQTLYSAAYVVPPPALGAQRKHTNHLRLLDSMMRSGVTQNLLKARTMSEAFHILRSFPAIGDFLAFQYLIDLNYSSVLNFDEMEFVVAGPGARDGLRKAFGLSSRGIEAELIRYMADTQEEHFARLGLSFNGLRGRRLQLIDCQNLFCEVDKYARVAHPLVSGISGRIRIKQKFSPVNQPVTAWFPPKWGLNNSAVSPAQAVPTAAEQQLAVMV